MQPPGPINRRSRPDGAEKRFVAWACRMQQEQVNRLGASGIHEAAGDDLAVLEWPRGLLLLGVDPVLDGVHVKIGRDGPGAAGRKAMNRNLSDVAAMAGLPVAATLSICAPKSMTMEQLQELYLAAQEAGERFACPIVGGDFATWHGPLVVTVGILARSEAPVLRGGARVGQGLFVTGPLGGSILGRHLNFLPKLDLGRTIAGRYSATSMIDLSDGLSSDLPRLLGPGCGAVVEERLLPIHDDARRLAEQTGRDPLWHALNDGEDYELLFTADARELPGCIRIGEVQDEPGIRLMSPDGQLRPLEAEGWEHDLEEPAA